MIAAPLLSGELHVNVAVALSADTDVTTGGDGRPITFTVNSPVACPADGAPRILDRVLDGRLTEEPGGRREHHRRRVAGHLGDAGSTGHHRAPITRNRPSPRVFVSLATTLTSTGCSWLVSAGVGVGDRRRHLGLGDRRRRPARRRRSP